MRSLLDPLEAMPLIELSFPRISCAFISGRSFVSCALFVILNSFVVDVALFLRVHFRYFIDCFRVNDLSFSSWNSDSSQSITSVFHRYMILLLISYVLRILEKALRLSTVPFQFPSLHFRSSSGSWSIRVHDIRIAHHSVLGECLIHVASFRPYCRRLMVPWNFLWRLCKPFAFLLIIKASPMLPSISCAVSSRQTSPL